MNANPRSSGVLMPVPMLNGPYGIGVLGNEAKEFIDLISESGFHIWQVLPVESTGAGFSPYSCLSAFAGEPMLIDPRGLLEMGLITPDELEQRAEGMDPNSVDYELVSREQWSLLRKAFSRLDSDEYLSFDPFWFEDYAIYMAVRESFDGLAWYLWPDDALRNRDADALALAKERLGGEINFLRFVQWLFCKQWRDLTEYARLRSVAIMGDMPFYPPADSADVWSHPELFEISVDGSEICFNSLAGAPPDYFTPEGQCWGNPTYNWKRMKKDGYSWWINRMREAVARYDIVRLDHFRGFESFWRIPKDSSAKDGEWVKGPGFPLFKALEAELGRLPVIAEDLGVIDEPVKKLLRRTGYWGMRVLQFGFLGDEGHLPHNFAEDCVAYTGTHDNTTLLDWLFLLRDEDRGRALFYLGFEGDWTVGGPQCAVNRAWIRQLMMSGASTVIVPIQDILGYGGDTRTNTPGVAEGNWRFRVSGEALSMIDRGFYRELNRAFARDNECPVKRHIK